MYKISDRIKGGVYISGISQEKQEDFLQVYKISEEWFVQQSWWQANILFCAKSLSWVFSFFSFFVSHRGAILHTESLLRHYFEKKLSNMTVEMRELDT